MIGEFPLLTLVRRRTSLRLFRTFCIVTVRNYGSADKNLLLGGDYGLRGELQYSGVVASGNISVEIFRNYGVIWMKLLLSFGQVDFVTQPRYESMMFDPTTSTRSSLAPSSLPVGRYVSHYLGVRRHLRDHYSPNIQVGTINIKITLKCQYESVSHIYKFYLLVIPWYNRVIERCFHFNSLTKNKGIRIHCLP